MKAKTTEKTMDVLCEALTRFPRITGLVLGIALHPLLSTLVNGR